PDAGRRSRRRDRARVAPTARSARRSEQTDVRRRPDLRAVPRRRDAPLGGLAPRSRDGGGERKERRRRFRWSQLQLRRRHLALYRRDGKFRVYTDGPDGTMREYEVAYTFGVAPLQQYLIAVPGGRIPGARRRVGRPAGGGRRPALVPSAPDR